MKFFFVEDVMVQLKVSRSFAYKLIKRLNKELEAEGYVTIAGRVPQQRFDERFYCKSSKAPPNATRRG